MNEGEESVKTMHRRCSGIARLQNKGIYGPYLKFNLGWMYANGHGVRQDLTLAQEWLGKACQNGDQNGCDNYQRLKAGY